MNGLYYYKLVSEYPEDVTKNCKLSINEIDSNFKVLKDNDISAVTFVREGCESNSGNTLVITRNNGEKIIVPMNTEVCKNFTYDLQTDVTECKKGATLTISYKDDDGEHTTVLENVITADNIVDVIGHDILTKVISDDTLIGLGTMRSPLGLAGVEKTGMLAPAISVLDLTDGSKLPKYAKKGTRYVTSEYVSDYGYLYNGAGVEKIQSLLDKLYVDNEINKEVEDRNYYWRVPSKGDWDKLLNSIEPCRYRNHNSTECHKELGKLAGKYLKAECGCTGEVEYAQSACTCSTAKPYDGCLYNGGINGQNESIDTDDYIFDNTDVNPDEKFINPTGIDKYGMTILPAGVSSFRRDTPSPSGFGTMSVFWTTSHVYDDPGQDIYLKVFDCDKSGVYQLAECPEPYYSIRLVKDYDGSNFHETEYIDGVLYKCVLFPESGQIWLASNVANTNGLIGYNEFKESLEHPTPEYLLPNNGDGIEDRRVELFINEFNGRYWEKKVMDEGVTIVIQDPCVKTDYSEYDYEWIDSDGNSHIITVEISGSTVTYTWPGGEYTIDINFNNQYNLEYRVYVDEETCEKYLKNVNDLIVERVLNILIPMLDKERNDREEADRILSGAIEDLRDDLNEEISARTAADDVLSGAIEDLRADVDELSGKVETLREDLEQEIQDRKDADEALSGAIDTEREERIAADIILDGQLIDWSKNPFTLSASTLDSDYNLVLPSKDGEDEHSIKIMFDGNFGEI